MDSADLSKMEVWHYDEYFSEPQQIISFEKLLVLEVVY